MLIKRWRKPKLRIRISGVMHLHVPASFIKWHKNCDNLIMLPHHKDHAIFQTQSHQKAPETACWYLHFHPSKNGRRPIPGRGVMPCCRHSVTTCDSVNNYIVALSVSNSSITTLCHIEPMINTLCSKFDCFGIKDQVWNNVIIFRLFAHTNIRKIAFK